MQREIGKVVIRWAHLEYLIQSFIWELAGVDERVGRLAIREPRVSDRMDLVYDLAELLGAKVDTKQGTAFKNRLNELSGKRDLIAHGIWTKTPKDKTWRVILTRGTHRPDADVPHRKRKISPEALKADPDGLRKLADQMEEMAKNFRTLRGMLRETLKASAEKRLRQYLADHRPDDPTNHTPLNPPQS